MRRQWLLRGIVFALLALWAAYSLADLEPLSRELSPEEAHGPLYGLAAVALPVLRVRGAPLLRPLPAAARSVAARGLRRLHPARRGDGRDRLRPQLARLVVGVARADGRRVRPRRARRPPGVPAQALGRGRLQGPLPRAHRGARRSPLCAGAQPCRRRGGGRRRVQRRGDAAPPAGRRRATQAGRALQPVPLAAAPGAAPRGAGRRRARRRAAGGQRALRRPAGLHGLLRALDAAPGGRDAEFVLGRGRPGRRRPRTG